MLDLIAALVDKSLVVREPEVLGQARYRMLDTIREYAAVRLADAGESAGFQRRLARLRAADRRAEPGDRDGAGPGPWSARVDVFRRYDVEAGNVAQVLSWCLAHADAETGLRICAAVSPCWIVWGTFAEGGEWLDSLPGPGSGPRSRPRVRGAATVVRAQLALSSDPAAAAAPGRGRAGAVPRGRR